MGLHSVAETARLIGVSQVSIYGYIKKGKLEAVIGGERKKEGQRGTTYQISDDAIAEFKQNYDIKGKKDEPAELFDKGHVLQSIFDYNHITIATYTKLRKYGGYAYVSSILSGNTAIPEAFVSEFCKFFDVKEDELVTMIRLKKFHTVSLRDEYDTPDVHRYGTGDCGSLMHYSDTVKGLEKKYPAQDQNDAEEDEATGITFIYFITKQVRTTDNPDGDQEIPLMDVSVFSTLEKAKNHLKSLAVRPDYIFISQDGMELIKTSIDKDTLKVTRTHLRIRKCEVE